MWRIGLVLLVACGSSGSNQTPADGPASTGDTATPDPDGASGGFVLPPLDARLDYQLGGPYAPPAGVMIVSRDRTAPIATGLYNICYVNGFQIQPGEEGNWPDELKLKDAGGNLVIDQDWNEVLVDTRTPEKRDAIMAIEQAWIDGCKSAGYDAIEIDNLDSYARSQSLISMDDNVAMMAKLSAASHAKHMAIAQKNSSEIVARKGELGTDFVVAEECNRYDECDAYMTGYGDHVLVIEYRQQDFTKGCTMFPGLSIVLRDRDLVTPGNGAYVYDGC